MTRKETQILLLKRNAHEKYHPNVFEMPGGKVKNGETLRDALTREVNEESGLVVSGILKPLATFSYTTTKTAKSPMTGNEEVIHRYAQQFSYVVTIEGDGSEFRVCSPYSLRVPGQQDFSSHLSLGCLYGRRHRTMTLWSVRTDVHNA
ncbi:hypothetical protein ACHAPO_004096 [Fusarium lateritium]